MPDSKLAGKVAIVTGAAGGIGRALVRSFAASGMLVGALDVERAAIDSALGDVDDDAVLKLACDVSSVAECAAATERIRRHFGRLDALVNNAALGMHLISPRHLTNVLQIEDIPAATWQSFLNVNLSGPFFMAQAAVPHFREQKCGRVINVTTSFFTMLRAGFAPYAASKAGLEAWSTGLAAELKGGGITVNIVIPGGPTDTAMVPNDARIDRSELIRPEKLAEPMLWLFSDEAAEVTGMRFIAAKWNNTLAGRESAALSGAPAGWPGLAGGFIDPQKTASC